MTRDLQMIHTGAHAEEYLKRTHINYRSVCTGALTRCINLTHCRHPGLSSSLDTRWKQDTFDV